ncbi:MAG: putative DNA binding domain-containing protein [Tannerellaceae bacterium]|jgi:ATP-dependent DNA helicase RecG|nr:putative DNA binding domain-containing protein [Tannerellaceae bacterium]
MLTAEEIKSIAASGAGYNAEFMVAVPSNVRELSQSVCAFANSGGGYILIGIDNNDHIVGTKIDNAKRSAIQNAIRDISPIVKADVYEVDVEGKPVWVLDVSDGNDKPYISSGAIYLREGAISQKLTTAEEIRSLFQINHRVYFDDVPCRRFDTKKDLDKNNFGDFLQLSSISGIVSTEQILRNLRAYEESGELKNGAVLFFGQEPETYFPQAIVRCVRFKGINKVHIIDDKRYGGPLYRQYTQAEAWIKDKLEVSYIISGTGPRKEVWEIPLTVFKEALINALSHRDYCEQGAVTMVEMYDDRIEISNPGGLLSGVKSSFGWKSMTRNPLIFGLFTRMNLVEQVGSGVPRMREAMSEAGLPSPDFSDEGIFFTAVFRRPIKKENTTDSTPSENENDIVNDERNGIVNNADGIVNEFNDPVNNEDVIVNKYNDIVTKENTTAHGERDSIEKRIVGIVNGEIGIVNTVNDIVNIGDSIVNTFSLTVTGEGNPTGGENNIVDGGDGIVNDDATVTDERNGVATNGDGIVNAGIGIVNNANGIVNDDGGIVTNIDATGNDDKNDRDVPDEIKELIFKLISEKEGIAAPEIAKHIGKSWRTTMRYLNKLKGESRIEFRGAPKTGGYYLKV